MRLVLSSLRLWSVAMLLCLCLCLSTITLARPFDEVIDSGFLSVFVYQDYAPYSWQDGDELKGIDVEIARAFGAELGVEVRFLVRGADENLDDDLRLNVWKGDLIHRKAADVMMHVPFDQEVDSRNEFVALTSPYFLEQMAVVANVAEMPVINTFGRFVNSPIGVELDTAGDFFLSNAFRGRLQKSIRRARTFEDVIRSYIALEVPAVLGSRAQAEWIAHQALAQNIESHIVQPPMPGIVRESWPIGIAIKHDSRDLGYALGDVITKLIDSGDLATITGRYGVGFIEPGDYR